MYKAPSGGSSAMFRWKCLHCDAEYGPSQYGDIKRIPGTRCCSQSKKYGRIRWGHKHIKPEYMRSLHLSARKRNIDFDVNSKYLFEIWEKQDGKCAYTGKSLSLGKGKASLDRIDPKRGYVQNNVQWVLTIVNYMKWDSTEEEFINLCSLIASRRSNSNDK